MEILIEENERRQEDLAKNLNKFSASLEGFQASNMNYEAMTRANLEDWNN